MIFWSFSFIWYKIANETFAPVTIVFTRLVIAVFILTVYSLLSGSFVRIRKKDRKYFFLLAFFEPFLYFLGESFGLPYVSSTAGSVIISTVPIASTLGAWIFFREKLKFINYAGILISFAGILVFIIDRSGSLSFNPKGLLLLMFAVCSAAGFNLTLSRLVGSYNPVFIVTVQNIIGVVLFLPVFMLTSFSRFMQTTITFVDFLPVIELAAFASCAAFILFAYAVKKLGVIKANVFINCIPIFTALMAFIILQDKLTIQNLLGMLIVITGLFMSQINGRQKENETAMTLTGKTA